MSIRKILTIAGPVACVSVYCDSDWNEYRVRVQGAKPEADYHTTDRDDAEGTAALLSGIVEPCPGHLM